jgi:beta-galactosidase
VGGPLSKAKSTATQLKDTHWLLDRNLSFCYYVFDGGTNFGFSNGANQWRPVQTTYDYDAPVDELGRVRPKFGALRELFRKELQIQPEAIPADPVVIEIPTFMVAAHRPMLGSLGGSPVLSENVMTMEDLDQAYGFILYRKRFDSLSGVLDLKKALDYSMVMIDGKVVGEAFAGLGADSFRMKLAHARPCTLDILVYNLGRNSVGINQSISRKGLNENPTLDGKAIRGWEIYSLPMDDPDGDASSSLSAESAACAPMIYSGEFALGQMGETYLDMRNWKFGVVWVNGHNLGRYWDVGGDRSLYLPSVWENRGTNRITILELGGRPKDPTLGGVENLIEEAPKEFHRYFDK